jgi:hypothetical protein
MSRRAMLVVALFGLAAPAHAAEVTVDQDEQGLVVKIDGQLFTRYLVKSGNKPVLWPLIGPTGKPMSRAWPIDKAGPDERTDHVHHRSFWFTHGDVGGVDFWSEGNNAGSIVHRKFVRAEGGAAATIETVNDWLDAAGKKVCEDQRRIVLGGDAQRRFIDFDITIKATEGKLTFGDTKEGSFGIRVAESMKVDAGKGGRIINSQGLADGAAWGKPAAWVDYHGPVDGEHLGVAILNHPSSFRYPTHWHVRTYGLFAANPFGLKDFRAGSEGAHTLQQGESITLRYRVLLHTGDEKQGKVAEAFAEYAAQKRE